MASISHRYRSIFFHIPKTGGISVKKFLEPYGFKIILANCHTIWTTEELQYKGLCMRFKEVISNDDIFDNYFKFCFVRNPWDRYVSAWKSLMKSGHIKDKFENFVLDPLRTANNDSIQDVIWHALISQTKQITDKSGNIMVDFVGRFENINEDFEKVCKKLNIPFNKLFKKNKTRHKHYSKYYNNKTMKIIGDLFEDDIKNFGYYFEKK